MALKNTALSIAGAAALIPFHLHAEDGGGAAAILRADEEYMIRYVRDRVPASLTVYGRVIDQTGDGVGGADVELHWRSAAWLLGKPDEQETLRLKSDEKGFWQADLRQPVQAEIRKVSKDGYERIGGEEQSRTNVVTPAMARDNPAVTVLRKKAPLTFLIATPPQNKGADVVLLQLKSPRSISRPLGLLAWEADGEWRGNATTNADLRVDAVFDEAGKCWNVTYSITNGPGGIVMSDGRPYEAPADGYVSSVSATFPVGHKMQKHLCVRSRTPEVYSRVLVEHHVRITKEYPFLRVFCWAWTNPYGDRSLESDERVAGVTGLADRLRHEALEALAFGKHPERPDIGRLVEEARKQMAREDEEKHQNSE